MNGIPDYKFNIRLVKTVKKYPLLYNTELKKSTIRDCRERAWIDVAEELNCDPKTAQKKWKFCRCILVRKLRQIQMGESVKQYYLYNHIKYLIPYLKKSYEPGTLKRTLTEPLQKINEDAETKHKTVSEHSIEDIEVIEDFTESSDESDENNDVCSEDLAETEVDDLVSISLRSEPTEKFLVNDKVTNCTPIQAATQSASYAEQRDQTVSSENPKRQFVLSLLPDLNEMTNSQMRQFKCKVLLLIDEILNENKHF